MRKIGRQLLFFLPDMWKNKWSFVFGMIQIMLALLLVGYMFSFAQTQYRSVAAFQKLQDLGDVYHISCIAEAGQIDNVISSEQGQKGFEYIYKYIENLEDTITFTADASMAVFVDAGETEADALAKDIRYGTVSFRTLRVTPYFFDVFQLNADVDANEIMTAFCQYSQGDVMPVLLGSGYRKYYQKGDIFYDTGGRAYRVLGFMEKGSLYAAPFESERARVFDDWMIVPLGTDRQGGGIGYITELTSTYFLTDSEDTMKALIAEFQSQELLPFSYKSLEDQVAYDLRDLKNEGLTMGSVMLLILLFAAAGMIACMIRYVHERLREFAVHMLCGAGMKDVMTRIVMQLCVILFLSNAIVCIVFQSLSVFLAVMFFSIFYGMCIAAYPIYLFKKQEIADVIRRNR